MSAKAEMIVFVLFAGPLLVAMWAGAVWFVIMIALQIAALWRPRGDSFCHPVSSQACARVVANHSHVGEREYVQVRDGSGSALGAGVSVQMVVVPASRVRPGARMLEIASTLPAGRYSAMSGPEIPASLGPQRALLELREVAEAHRIDWRVILGYARHWPVVRARQELMYRLRKMGWALPRIGRFVNRDHTTVLHGIKRHARRHGLVMP